jgi:D-glycero-alpha-D-manno-heptose 1-phosphate guanylyltransferase
MSVEWNQVAAVVLAGGFGTRVQHLLPDVPKPMASVAGRPFLEWVVRYLAGQGVREVVLSTGFRAEVIERHFAASPVPGVRCQCVRETGPLGTAGGFLHAANSSGLRPTTWLVLNGDSLALAALDALRGALDDTALAGVILGREIADASRFGTLVTDGRGDLARFDEKRPGRAVINAGVYLLRHELLARFGAERPLSFEREVFPALITAGARLRVHAVECPFLDIGTPETLPQAEEFLRGHSAWFGPPAPR